MGHASASPQATRFWSNARPWQWISLAASVVAIAFAVLLLRGPVRETGHLMVSSIRQNGVTDWTATVDLDRRQVILVPAATTAIPNGRSTQLWLIRRGSHRSRSGVCARCDERASVERDVAGASGHYCDTRRIGRAARRLTDRTADGAGDRDRSHQRGAGRVRERLRIARRGCGWMIEG